MRTRHVLVIGAGALALATAGCGSSGSAGSSGTSSAPAAAGSSSASAGAVKVAFITKFPVAFYSAMVDSAKAWAAKNPGADITYFNCKSPSDVQCQTAQIEDAVTKGFQAMVITPWAPRSSRR